MAPHIGRGGWTWYTGSAGWMYRLIIESLLGLHLEVDKLTFKPCLPAEWQAYTIHYRYRETVYHVDIKRATPDQTGTIITVDGVQNRPEDAFVQLVDDRIDHRAEISYVTTEAKLQPLY